MPTPLRILHCLRAPVGGLFRHVLDLAESQADLGHAVSILCDSRASDALTTAKLEAIRPKLALGLHLVPMSRNPGFGDLAATQSVASVAKRLGLDVLHGHGAKGGLYARLASARLRRSGAGLVCVYTPHGGVLHFDPKSLKGRVLLGAERAIASLTDAIVFESAFSEAAYRAKIGEPSCATRVIPNGLKPEEFAPVVAAPDAADLLFVGELRHLKGIDVLIEAIAGLPSEKRPSAIIVGAGPDAETFKTMARERGLNDLVTFPGALPARDAFRLGRCLVVPSRAESFPYIVLEAAAAGLPMIATNVGGIPEIFAEASDRLIPPGDPKALRGQIETFRSDPSSFASAAQVLKAGVQRRFAVRLMAQSVLDLYRDRLNAGADAHLRRTG